MLGYLNAPNPFDEAGWLDTGDVIEKEGEYIRILGRESEIINVGGQKVFPIEVEEVLSAIPEINEVTVSGEPHLIMGQSVVAAVRTHKSLPTLEIKRLIKRHCKGRLQDYMIPSKIRLLKDSAITERFKKSRSQQSAMING